MLRRALPLLLVFSFLGAPAQAGPGRADEIKLPEPDLSEGMTLNEALSKRRSRRRVAPEALSMGDIGQMLWAAQGITLPQKGFRTAPSAGARYPLRIYVLLASGVYRYVPARHSLVSVRDQDLREALWKDVYGRPWLDKAPLMIAIAADDRRTVAKYGKKAQRFVYMEAGHAGQNLLLQGTALGLHGVGVGAFHARRTHKTLALPKTEELVYMLVFGKPSS